jgi:hypothetical protein
LRRNPLRYEMIRVTLVQPAALNTTASSAASQSVESDSWVFMGTRPSTTLADF